MIVLFFGCWNAPGHFWFAPDGRWTGVRITDTIPFSDRIDGGYAPRSWKKSLSIHKHLVKNPTCCFVMEGNNDEDRRRIEYDTDEYDQGQFLLHHKDDYTLMSWWDRAQGDRRPACNSSLVAQGTIDSFEMYELLLQNFPRVAANLVSAGIALREVNR